MAELHIVGDGPMRGVFEKEIRESDLSGAITFHGFVEEGRLMEVLASFDQLVFPFPNSLLNIYRCPNKAFLYAQTDLPIITNPVGEVYTLLREEPGTFFYEEESLESFYMAVRKAKGSGRRYNREKLRKAASWRVRKNDYLKMLGRVHC